MRNVAYYIFTILLIGSNVLFAQEIKDSNKHISDTTVVSGSKSGYHELDVKGGARSVNAELKSDDEHKNTLINKNYSDELFGGLYGLKNKLFAKYRLAIGMDYMLLNQLASFSYSDRQASSGIFRFFSSWKWNNSQNGNFGYFIFKLENRHNIGSGVTPRNLGYEAGAALSTASFKDFGWGLTNFYWKQLIIDKYFFVAGIMDPGDWIDLYPLLNPFKNYLNEAFFNNPAMPIPNQGLGLAFSIDIVSGLYAAGGIHDANGQPQYFLFKNFESFFTTSEYFFWAELGWNKSKSILEGQTIHLTYWYQDAREETGSEASRGLCFSASRKFGKRYTSFFRAAISEGNAALMHHLLIGGVQIEMYSRDNLGLGVHWGGPVDRSKPNQLGLEAYYSLQITQNLNITPDIQLTINPSFNEEKNVIGIYSTFRIRYAL